MPGRDFTQNPGPTNIPDRVLEAFRRPAVDFDSPEFHAVVNRVWEQLPSLFGGAEAVIVLTAVGHGAWESSLVNVLNPGDQFLMANAGRFGHRYGEVAEALGFSPIYTDIDVRRPADPADIHDRLVADTEHHIKGVFLTQTETSTGTVTDVPEVRRAIDAADHPALFVVDAIGSFGTETMRMADWGIDVVVASSQKGLMMPPGLGFCAISARALEHSTTVITPRSHWDWKPRMDHSYIYKRFDGTPPEQHIFALDAALDLITEEGGIDVAVARHKRLAQAVHAAIGGWGKEGPWEINALEPHRANAVTCVRTGEIDADELRILARDRFRVSVGAGMLGVDANAFRIGHLGDMNEPMILGALGGLELAMETLGLPHGSGLPAAVETLAVSD
jgi:alanine-glyoxylate transaminase/serine-glyoxylate transaminase/serine-pyruvate transaminase